MKRITTGRLACRYCQHFSPEGRRGGTCHQLGVPVRGDWHACSLVRPSFTPILEDFEEPILIDELVPSASVSYPPILANASASQIPA
jgi:hypothetical protein